MKSRLIFLPGYACTADIWRLCLDDLAGRYDASALFWPTELTPDFHDISDFSDWLRARIVLTPGDILIGHSLGGLVALDVAGSSGTDALRVILVESFLRPPSVFFRNLLMPTAPPALVSEVNDMLEREKPRYSATLRERLASLDIVPHVERTSVRIDAVYGDRGCGAAETVDSLGWPEPLRESVDVHIIADACHFPMLEQPVEMAHLFRDIIDTGD